MPTSGRGPNARAIGATVAALKKAGRLERTDQAIVATLRFTAGQLDQAEQMAISPAAVASLVRAHLAGLRQLMGGPSESGDEALDDLLAALSAPVGHPSPS